ncbi:MAG: hypothetical protein AVDCRST_MAG22-1765, partial [uncultured Rubrobacteraceae bacterium]
ETGRLRVALHGRRVRGVLGWRDRWPDQLRRPV